MSDLIMLPEDEEMIHAGIQFGVLSIATGHRDAFLTKMCQLYAQHQANICQQDEHAGWDQRYEDCVRNLPDFSGFQEVTAESWANKGMARGAWEQFDSWRQSPGHWSVVNGECSIYGYAMRKGKNGIWYGTGIAGHRRK